MQIAQVLANYTLGGADLLRRAMGKKKPEEMEKQRGTFTDGAIKRGVDKDTATHIFDLMEKFAGYGFNKSHSAAYALVSYQTLWLKAHYPAAFMAAVLSADMDHTDKVVTLIEECREMKLKVESPHVNHSECMFTISGDNTVIYGLGAIKGVGQAAIEGIIEARKQDGAYVDLFDFCGRIDLRKANRRVLESLIRAGALDELGPNRATLMMHLPIALKMAEQQVADRAAGQNDLFGMGEATRQLTQERQLPLKESDEWSEKERLQGEKDTLGLYLTGHPISRYEPELPYIVTARIAGLDGIVDSGGGQNSGGNGGYRRKKATRVVVAGLVVSIRQNQTARGRMASLLLDDRSGRIEATLFADVYEDNRELLVTDKILVVAGGLSFDDFRGGLNIRVDQVFDFEQVRETRARHILLRADYRALAEKGLAAKDFSARLKQVLSAYSGGSCPVRLEYQRGDAKGAVDLGPEWNIRPTDELLLRLERLFGREEVKVVFGARN